jgi:HEPN domain-containing protein
MLHKASEDREALAYNLPDAIFGFLAQQAFEKLFKALIAARNVTYDRTHNLAALVNQLQALGEHPLPLLYPFLKLQVFAVVFRYDHATPIDSVERQQIREAIDALTAHVRRRALECAATNP